MSLFSRYIKPKRGSLLNLKNLDMTHQGELIYINDMNLFGIINYKEEIQFLAEVRRYNTKADFPKPDEIKENAVLYKTLDTGLIYYFDLTDKDYKPIKLNTETMTYGLKC